MNRLLIRMLRAKTKLPTSGHNYIFCVTVTVSLVSPSYSKVIANQKFCINCVKKWKVLTSRLSQKPPACFFLANLTRLNWVLWEFASCKLSLQLFPTVCLKCNRIRWSINFISSIRISREVKDFSRLPLFVRTKIVGNFQRALNSPDTSRSPWPFTNFNLPTTKTSDSRPLLSGESCKKVEYKEQLTWKEQATAKLS